MVNPDACLVYYVLEFRNNKSNVGFRMSRKCNYGDRCNATKNQGKYFVRRLFEPSTLHTHWPRGPRPQFKLRIEKQKTAREGNKIQMIRGMSEKNTIFTTFVEYLRKVYLLFKNHNFLTNAVFLHFLLTW